MRSAAKDLYVSLGQHAIFKYDRLRIHCFFDGRPKGRGISKSTPRQKRATRCLHLSSNKARLTYLVQEGVSGEDGPVGALDAASADAAADNRCSTSLTADQMRTGHEADAALGVHANHATGVVCVGCNRSQLLRYDSRRCTARCHRILRLSRRPRRITHLRVGSSRYTSAPVAVRQQCSQPQLHSSTLLGNLRRGCPP